MATHMLEPAEPYYRIRFTADEWFLIVTAAQ